MPPRHIGLTRTDAVGARSLWRPRRVLGLGGAGPAIMFRCFGGEKLGLKCIGCWELREFAPKSGGAEGEIYNERGRGVSQCDVMICQVGLRAVRK
jgi:hypothetical protein